MGARSEPEDQNSGVGISERRDGASPVFLIAVGSPLYSGDAGTVFPQAGAKIAVNNFLF
jgi:hypothetical protein